MSTIHDVAVLPNGDCNNTETPFFTSCNFLLPFSGGIGLWVGGTQTNPGTYSCQRILDPASELIFDRTIPNEITVDKFNRLLVAVTDSTLSLVKLYELTRTFALAVDELPSQFSSSNPDPNDARMLAPADVTLTTDGLTAYVIDIIQKCAFKFQYGEFTYVEDKNNNSLPKEFVIEQNFPNPSNPFSISIDYTNQSNRSNLIKARIRIYYWDIVNNGVNSSYQANSYISRSRFAEYYRAYPISAVIYLQNKMEYEGMIANIGFRAEAFNFQARVLVDKFNVFYQGTGGPGTLGNP